MMHNPPIQFVIGLFRNVRPYEKRELVRKGSCKRLLIGKNPALWGTLKCQDSALQMSFSVKWDTRRSDHISQPPSPSYYCYSVSLALLLQKCIYCKGCWNTEKFHQFLEGKDSISFFLLKFR
jgi:hypothetical protein